jgi:hypothetical protein
MKVEKMPNIFGVGEAGNLCGRMFIPAKISSEKTKSGFEELLRAEV